jgi:hypothetical protein
MAHLNPHLHENLVTQIEDQIEDWNRKAVRHANPEEAHRLWQKAEGLQYALRVLYAFKHHFDDLVQAAARSTGLTGADSTSVKPRQEVSDP